MSLNKLRDSDIRLRNMRFLNDMPSHWRFHLNSFNKVNLVYLINVILTWRGPYTWTRTVKGYQTHVPHRERKL